MFKTELTPLVALSALAMAFALPVQADAVILPRGYLSVDYVTIPVTTEQPQNAVVLPNVTWKAVKKITCRYATTCTTTAGSGLMLFSAANSLAAASAVTPYVALTGTKGKDSNASLNQSGLNGSSLVKTAGCTYNRDGSTNEFSVINTNSSSDNYFQFGGAWNNISWTGTVDIHELVLYGANDVELAHLYPAIEGETEAAGFYDTVAGAFRTKFVSDWPDFIPAPITAYPLEVASAAREYGPVTPAYGGARPVTLGEEVKLSAPSSVALEGGQAVCTGAILYTTDAYGIGAWTEWRRENSETFSFEMPPLSVKVVWQWRERVPPTVAAPEVASVSGTSVDIRLDVKGFGENDGDTVDLYLLYGPTAESLTAVCVAEGIDRLDAFTTTLTGLQLNQSYVLKAELRRDGATQAASEGLLPAPSVTLDRVQQRYPWNGLVDIDYTVSGVRGKWADYVVCLGVTGKTNGVDFAVTPKRFLTAAADDLPSSNGTYRVTWDTAADGVELLARGATVTAQLVYDPVTEGEADYAVIDISAGIAADAVYPVRYIRGDIPTSAFNVDAYKTTKIVLKRVPKTSGFWMSNGAADVSSGTKRFRVALTDDFFLGVFELTLQQYILLTGNTPKTTVSTDPVRGPVSALSWNFANGIFPGLNARARHNGDEVTGFSLPTEAQWQYACRAGCALTYYWGSNANTLYSDYMWFAGNAGGKNHPVGEKLPNGWGFYDMLGNVSEWVLDFDMTRPAYSADAVTVNWVGTSGKNMVYCGGSRGDNTPNCATRGTRAPATNHDDWNGGVRICRPVVQ